MNGLTFKRLPSGYVHIRGTGELKGPCNWAQPPAWPCTEEELEATFFGEAGDRFRRAVRTALAATREEAAS